MSSQLLFMSFILIIFFLLTLLALNIYLVSRLFSRKESAKFTIKSPNKKTIQNISHQINLRVQLENFEKTVIEVCPVKAITLVNAPKKHFLISENRCLGEACLECQRLILLKQFEIERS
ncbi:MAG: hypothetical protein JSU57_02620 [Candidatus Heimdallarchaeota archaeon]|nr:MAG: hypothetical protein JSU57_02620 [Candidatus Heimdallarchaeota archaeon]